MVHGGYRYFMVADDQVAGCYFIILYSRPKVMVNHGKYGWLIMVNGNND